MRMRSLEDGDYHTNWQTISFFPNILKSKLDRLGYKHEEILREWRDKGWIEIKITDLQKK